MIKSAKPILAAACLLVGSESDAVAQGGASPHRIPADFLLNNSTLPNLPFYAGPTNRLEQPNSALPNTHSLPDKIDIPQISAAGANVHNYEKIPQRSIDWAEVLHELPKRWIAAAVFGGLTLLKVTFRSRPSRD